MLLDYGMKRGKRARVPVEIGICSVPLRFRSITSKFSHFFFFFSKDCSTENARIARSDR